MVSLQDITLELAHEYFKDFQSDPDIFMDMDRFVEYRYSPRVVDAYYNIRKASTADRKDFFIMHEGKPIGEIALKHIDYGKKQAELSIHLQNDAVKNKGFGTQAEKLLLDYAFDVLHLDLVIADSVLKNTRSQRVLEKVGFDYIKQEGIFKFYQFTRQKYEKLKKANMELLWGKK